MSSDTQLSVVALTLLTGAYLGIVIKMVRDLYQSRIHRVQSRTSWDQWSQPIQFKKEQ